MKRITPNNTVPLVGEGDGAGGGASRRVDDGPKRTVLLGNKADRAAGEDPSQRDGTAIVGRAVLNSPCEG